MVRLTSPLTLPGMTNLAVVAPAVRPLVAGAAAVVVAVVDATVVGDYRKSLAPLGKPVITALGPPRLRGGFVNRNFSIKSGKESMTLVTYAEPGANGRFEQFLVMPE